MATIDLGEIARLRLRNQRVMGGAFGSATEAVGWLGAVQSQDYPMAKWSLAQRVGGLADADVDQALADGTILRTHILRPTWHFVLPADIRPMMALTAPRILTRNRPPAGVPGLEPATIRRGLDVVGDAMAGGQRLSRAQLARLLVERGVVLTELDAVPIFMRAELDLVIVSGGPVGRTQTYALADERAPRLSDFDRDWALGELTRRYFTGHGPATVADFTWWSSLTVADTRRGLEINAASGRALEQLKADGTTYWWAGDTSDRSTPDNPSPTVHLMQAYDEYIVAYRSPRSVINLAGVAPPSGINRPPMLHAVVLDGQLVGWWRRLTTADEVVVETALLVELDRGQRAALEAAGQRYGRFVGKPVRLEARP